MDDFVAFQEHKALENLDAESPYQIQGEPVEGVHLQEVVEVVLQHLEYDTLG